jgi:Tol biopolymer transport system component
MRSGLIAVLASSFCALILAVPAEAAFPGQDGKIAFVRGGDIYTINPDGTGTQQLTTTGNNSEPAWSANGRRIAFTSDRDGNDEIYVMDQNGAGQMNLTNDPADDSHPTWSPGGDRITFDRLTPFVSFDIYVMNADGTGAVDITDGPGESGVDPTWSPDGGRIAFVDINNITLINPDGTGLLALTHYPIPTRDSHINTYDPNWSPDGQRIAFWAIAGGGPYFFFDLRVMRSDGTEIRTAYLNLQNGEGTWSPDGREIVVEGDLALERLDVSTTDFTTLPPTTPIPNTSSSDYSPDWQPVVPGPQRSDYKNAAKFCKAEREFLGEEGFGQKYGGGANAHGKCVSGKAA